MRAPLQTNTLRSLRCWAVLAAAACLLVACSKNKNPEQPAKLAKIKSSLHVERIWGASVADRGAKRLRLGLPW